MRFDKLKKMLTKLSFEIQISSIILFCLLYSKICEIYYNTINLNINFRHCTLLYVRADVGECPRRPIDAMRMWTYVRTNPWTLHGRGHAFVWICKRRRISAPTCGCEWASARMQTLACSSLYKPYPWSSVLF